MNNRNKANKILAVVFVLFAAATILKLLIKQNFMIELAAFICEAALVGGIADWFAVTALFRKPLGFSWHTALIPNNRDMIVEKVADLVEDELISPEAISGKLSAMKPTDLMLDKLSELIESEFIKQQFSEFISDKVEQLDSESLSKNIDSIIRDNLMKESISIEIRNTLNNAVSRGNHSQWLTSMISKAASIARKPETREKIYNVLTEQSKYSEENSGSAVAFFIKTIMNISNSSEHTNLRAISGVLQSELVSMLEQLGDETNPVFVKLQEKFEDLVTGLDNDNTLTNAIQTWKNGILQRIDLVENLDALITTAVQSQLSRNEAAALITSQLSGYSLDLKNDETMKAMADEVVRDMLGKIIMSEHHLIGEVVRETLGAFTNERLNDFIEDKAGEDLQWIRINGSIVGAIAGALIFLFANLLYQPYIVPAIRGLFGL